ncbi:MAG: hypothetical protein RL769_508, partial [Pseudomonadota bacterium]
ILYIYPIFKAGFFNEKNPRITKKYIPLPMRMAILIAIGLSIALSFYIQNFINFFSNNFSE